MYYVYIIQSKQNNSLYIGYTTSLKQRIIHHNQGLDKSTKYMIPWELIYFEAYKDQKLALTRERRLKYYGKALAQLKKRIGL